MNQRQSGNGIGFGTVLFIVFLVLKLTGVIDWSWWWVFSPLWIPITLIGLIFLGILAYYGYRMEKQEGANK